MVGTVRPEVGVVFGTAVVGVGAGVDVG